MHRNAQLIRESSHLIDGLVVPGHILAYQRPSTSAFVTALAAKGASYIIDPMTWCLQYETRMQMNEAGDELRPSYLKLYEALDEDLVALVMGNDILSAEQIRGILPSLTEACLEFQLTAVETGAEASAASKYLKKYGGIDPGASRPRAVIPPYFSFGRAGDEWYELSIDAVRRFVALAPEIPVAPIIACPLHALQEAKRIAADLNGVGQVVLWIDDLNENVVSAGTVRSVREAIEAISEEIDRVEVLFGGYLMLMMAQAGLSAVSHGILYSQHKAIRLTGSGGGVAERFYIPRIHQFRSLSQTDLILHQHPELIPDNPICAQVFDGNPDNIIHFFDNPELLRVHFLEARRAEADHVDGMDRADEARELRATHADFHASFVALRNPDAIRTGTPMPGLDYLQSWADGLA